MSDYARRKRMHRRYIVPGSLLVAAELCGDVRWLFEIQIAVFLIPSWGGLWESLGSEPVSFWGPAGVGLLRGRPFFDWVCCGWHLVVPH